MSNIRIGHLEVDTPWGNAGGIVKTLEDVELMLHTGVGWSEISTITREKRIGNSPNGEVVYAHNPATGETANSLGMPNKGIDVFEAELPEMVRMSKAYKKPLIVNVAPVSEDAVSESQELVERVIAAGAPAVLLNAGCPNVVAPDGSGRHEILSHNAEAFELVLHGLGDIVEKYDMKLFTRVSPFTSVAQAAKVYAAIRRSGVISAVFTPNTFPIPAGQTARYLPEAPPNTGGLSGPAKAMQARQQTAWAVYALRGSSIDVVSSSSIMNGRELHRRLSIDAVAGAGTTLYYESAEEGWSEATDRLLREYADLVA